jgi:GTP-binding protein HflX
VWVAVRVRRAPTEEETDEFTALASAAGAECVAGFAVQVDRPHPRQLVGKGKLDEIRSAVVDLSANLVLIDHELSPGQERNLERDLKCRVVDRTGLILDIFAQRARTSEGKLQVELAQLEHLSTRLVRGWTHLERQKGGIGLRGPGETQLETDRRLVAARIRRLKTRLGRLETRRDLSRKRRRKNDTPTVSLVGYTNAGKSTLFNRLVDADVKVADQLFATLDPTMRTLELPDERTVVLADTVGFVRDLPHELVAAFQSTLEETAAASLLLHVVDGSNPLHEEQIAAVEEVLDTIGAGGLPQLLVYNKADILGSPVRVDRAETGLPWRVWVSAATGTGISELLACIAEFLRENTVTGTVRLAAADARLRSLLYARGRVAEERPLDDGGCELDLELNSTDYERLRQSDGLELQPVLEQ